MRGPADRRLPRRVNVSLPQLIPSTAPIVDPALFVAATTKAHAQQPAAPVAVPFIASAKFAGEREGYKFQRGPKGMGYYADSAPAGSARGAVPVPDNVAAARAKEARAAARDRRAAALEPDKAKAPEGDVSHDFTQGLVRLVPGPRPDSSLLAQLCAAVDDMHSHERPGCLTWPWSTRRAVVCRLAHA